MILLKNQNILKLINKKLIYNNNILSLKYYYIMEELNTEKNNKKTIKSTKSTKNNKISIENDIDDMANKYNNMEISKKAKEKQLYSTNKLTKNDIMIISFFVIP